MVAGSFTWMRWETISVLVPPKSRGRHCGNIQPVSLVLDLHIDHDRFGSNSDPNLNRHLHYPHDVDKSLNEAATDKIRKYRSEYNNNPRSVETDRFFSSSGVHLPQSTSGLCHRVSFLTTLKAKSHPHQDCNFTYHTI